MFAHLLTQMTILLHSSQGIGTAIEKSLAALDVMQTSLIASALATNQTWPYVTIQKFASLATKVR